MMREEGKLLVEWCTDNNRYLIVSKTKEMMNDFKRMSRAHVALSMEGTMVERVRSFNFLTRRQKGLDFLRRLRRSIGPRWRTF